MAEDALAKAKAIAAKLSGGIISTDLGKRKNRWDEDQNSATGGFGCKLCSFLYHDIISLFTKDFDSFILQ